MTIIDASTETVICERYVNGESSRDISRTMEGVSEEKVVSILKRNGIERRKGSPISRRYTCNERFFEVIDTEEKAYWLGFLAADGSVDEKKRSVIFGLHAKDTDTVCAFRNAISATNPVATYGGEKNRHSKIVIVSEIMVNDLRKHGLIAPLSFGIQWPDLHPDLMRHFLRGYSDGDGTFHSGARLNRPSLAHAFSIVGPRTFMERAESFMQGRGFGRKILTWMKHTDPRIVYLTYAGRLQVQRVVHLLYDDATAFLPRKRETAMSFLDAPVTERKSVWGNAVNESGPTATCPWCKKSFQKTSARSTQSFCCRSCAAFARHSA